MSHPSWTAPTGTRLTLDHDLRARPRKRPRETPSINLPPNSAPAKPRSHPTASHPPLRRLFASVPSPILSNKRFGNLLDPLFSDLLAIISKQFVLSWYARICPLKENTKPFSARVTQILIHLIRELERRCGALDPITLLLGDVPTLLNRHLHDIQQAHRRLSFQRQRGTEPEVTFDEVFMRLRPHPAIQLTTVLHSSSSVSPAGTLVDPIPKFPTARALPSPTYLRLLVEALMERVLPAEDWAPETERLIVREIIVNVVMAPLFCKLSEPSTIHRLLTIHLASLAGEPSPVPPSQSSLRGRLLGLLHQILHVLLLLPSLYQSLSQLPDIPSTASDPQLFNPLLTLLATVFGAEQRSHIAQLCWLLALAVRMFGGVLNRLVVHLVQVTILSPIALSHLIVRVTTILEQLTQEPEPDPLGHLDPAMLHDAAHEALAAALPPALCHFLEPGLTEDVARKKVAVSFLLPLAEQTANVSLIFDGLELLLVRLFPELAEWEDE